MCLFYPVFFYVQHFEGSPALEQAKATVAGSGSWLVYKCVCVGQVIWRREIDASASSVHYATVTPPSSILPFPAAVVVRPQTGGPQVSRWLLGFTWRLRPQHWRGSPGGGCHVLSFKMTVARMRKKVFQPRVTAKPRHTIIRDRPQPVGKIHDYIQPIQEAAAGRVTSCFLSLSFLKRKCSRRQTANVRLQTTPRSPTLSFLLHWTTSVVSLSHLLATAYFKGYLLTYYMS